MMTDAQLADQLADWLHGSLGAVDPSPELLGRVTRDVAATTQARSRWARRGLGGGRRRRPSSSVHAMRVGLLVVVGACAALGVAMVVAPRPTTRLAVGAGPSYPPLPSLPARGPLTSQVPGGPVHGTLPTVGRVPDDPDAPMPDFIPVTYRDRDGIAGYVASRDLDHEGTFPWWYQHPPVPVYAEDLWTLVGFMFDGKGFVPLGVDPNTIAGVPARHEGPGSSPEAGVSMPICPDDVAAGVEPTSHADPDGPESGCRRPDRVVDGPEKRAVPIDVTTEPDE